MAVFLNHMRTHGLGFGIDNGKAGWFVITFKTYYHKHDFMKGDIVALMATGRHFIR